MSAVALVCLGRRARAKSARPGIGTSFEETYWPTIHDAALAAVELATPFCGPCCLGFHALVWHDDDGYHVVTAGSLPPELNPLNRQERQGT